MDAVLSPEDYEAMWDSLAEGYDTSYLSSSMTRKIQNLEGLTEESVEDLFKQWRIYSIATAEEETFMQFYLYAEHKSGVKACLQLDINKTDSTLMLKVKCQNEELAGFISKYVVEFLQYNEIV